MSAANNANDATLGAARARDPAQPNNAGNDRVSVHGVIDMVARDEDIAVDVRERYVGHHKAIAFLMKHQAALDFVARRGLVLREPIAHLGPGAL